MDTFIYLFALIIVGVSALIQGITGFGFALIAVPLMSVFMVPKDIVPMVVVFSLIMNIIMFMKKREPIVFSEFKLILIFGILGIPFGVYLLNILSPDIIRFFAALLIIATSIALMWGWELKSKNENISTAVAGFLSGFLNGSTSMSGPPIVLLLANQKVGKETFRSYLPTYGIVTNLITLGIFMLSGNLNFNLFKTTVLLSPALLVGLWIGMIVIRFINEKFFRKLSLMLILVTGLYALVSAWL